MTYKSTIAERSGESFVKEFIDTHGPFLDPVSIPEEEITPWEGVLPDILIDLWRNFGIGAIHNGLLRLCKPEDFDGLLELVFHDDPDFSAKDCHVFAYGAFGKLLVWE